MGYSQFISLVLKQYYTNLNYSRLKKTRNYFLNVCLFLNETRSNSMKHFVFIRINLEII